MPTDDARGAVGPVGHREDKARRGRRRAHRPGGRGEAQTSVGGLEDKDAGLEDIQRTRMAFRGQKRTRKCPERTSRGQ